jgi:hypothetical protein
MPITPTSSYTVGPGVLALGAVGTSVDWSAQVKGCKVTPKVNAEDNVNVLSGGQLAGEAAAIVRAGRAAVPYANPVHWGWPSHHIKANPWIQEAADRTEPAWSGLYLSALDAIVQTIEGAPGP